MFGGVLILRDVVFADTAVYQCEATNKHGSALLNTFLHVVGKWILQSPHSTREGHFGLLHNFKGLFKGLGRVEGTQAISQQEVECENLLILVDTCGLCQNCPLRF